MSASRTKKPISKAAAAMNGIANMSAVLDECDAPLSEIPDEINRQQVRAMAALIEATGFPVEGTYDDSETRLQQRRVEKRKHDRAYADSPPETNEQQPQSQKQQQPAPKKSPSH